MVIDFHTHTFPAKIAAKTIEKLSHTSHTVPFSDGTAEGLIQNMKRAGIDRSVILPVATSPRQVEKVNDASALLNETRQADGLVSFGCIHPDYENYRAELARFKRLGLPGVKLHPVYQDVDLDDVRFLRIIDRAAELGLIVITHAGLDVGYPGIVRCSPQMARRVVSEIGTFPFVLAHMGGWRNWEEVPEFLADTGVFLDSAFSTGSMHPLDDGWWKPEDLAMLDTDGFMKLFHAFGAGRILFGTDSPWSPPEEALAFIRDLPISDDAKEDILWRNAAGLLTA